jgi:phenylpropionate dioxygenase-like ring-hydroxylating dioxygenase large terminal subunit
MLQNTDKPFHDYVDVERHTVDRIIFSDQAVYEMELERIFARAWNFMCHESQIPKAGDFFLSFIGEESVIATRDKKGELQVLLNSCRHRGNAVCRAETGNARSFLCTYHGWTYGLDGSLIGVPGYKDFYHEQLDKSQWGLVKAGKVASYKGFVFATMDPDAPDLEEFLGPVGRLSIDLLAERGDLMIVEGIQKNQITCNWKLAVDNLFDFYHASISHASAYMSGFRAIRNPNSPQTPDYVRSIFRVVMGDYGHAIGGPKVTAETLDKLENEPDTNPRKRELWRRRKPGAREILGEVGMEAGGHPNIFPNMWLTGNQICLRLPKGPEITEMWWFTLVDKSVPVEQQEEVIHNANHNFGPAGFLEQDDGENWDQSTRATRGSIARRYPLNYEMGAGNGAVKHAEGITYVDELINEHAQFWTYRAWADWMDAENWPALKASRTVPQTEGVI